MSRAACIRMGWEKFLEDPYQPPAFQEQFQNDEDVQAALEGWNAAKKAAEDLGLVPFLCDRLYLILEHMQDEGVYVKDAVHVVNTILKAYYMEHPRREKHG